jgi:hypothetical protein
MPNEISLQLLRNLEAQFEASARDLGGVPERITPTPPTVAPATAVAPVARGRRRSSARIARIKEREGYTMAERQVLELCRTNRTCRSKPWNKY